MTYSELFLSLFPEAFWEHQETTGNVVNDSANSHTGFLYGGYVRGAEGLLINEDSVSLDTINRAYINLSTINLGTVYNLTFLIKSTEWPNLYNAVFFGDGGNDFRYAFYGTRLTVRDYGTGASAYISGFITSGLVNHVSINVNNGDITTYFNGVESLSVSGLNLGSFDFNWLLGQAGTNNIDAFISHQGVFTRTLTPAEIKALSDNALLLPKGDAHGYLPSFRGNANNIPPNTGDAHGFIPAFIGNAYNPLTGDAQGILPKFVSNAYQILSQDFVLVLSGSRDGLSQTFYPIKSLIATEYSGSTSTYNFQLPYQKNLVEEFSNRTNGELSLYYKGQRIFYCTFKYLNYNVGATSQTIGINGFQDSVNTSPKSILLDAQRVEEEKENSSGKRVFTVLDYFDIAPMDYIVFKGESIQIDSIRVTLDILAFSYRLTEL